MMQKPSIILIACCLLSGACAAIASDRRPRPVPEPATAATDAAYRNTDGACRITAHSTAVLAGAAAAMMTVTDAKIPTLTDRPNEHKRSQFIIC